MADDLGFGLGEDMPPLDLNETLGAPAVPGSAPSPRARMKEFAPLLALLPIALAKGGRVGVAALLQSFQQSKAQQQAQGRQVSLDQQRQQQVQSQEQRLRQQQEDTRLNSEAQRRQQFMQSFQTGLGTLDNEAAVRAYLAMMGPQAQGLGLPVERLEGFALEQMTPTRLQKREAERIIDGAVKQYKDTAPQHRYTLSDGSQVDWAELNRRAGVTMGAASEVPKDKRAFAPKDITLNGRRMTANYDPDTGLYYAIGNNTAPLTGNILEYERPSASGGGGATDARTTARIDRIVSSFNSHPIVKEFNEVQAQHGIIKEIVGGQWSGPGDMAAVFAFMKALDPKSVVRETEYANAARSGNIFAGWAARFNGAVNPNGGFLSDYVRRDFLRTIESRLSIKGKQYQNLRSQLVGRVDRIKAGAPETGDEALVDYEAASPADISQDAPPATTTKPNPFERPR